jgi:hypothetical protein
MRRMVLELPARTVQILAEAYELSPDEVEQDVAVLQAHASSSIDLLERLRRRHTWDTSTCVYYLVALRRALRGMPAWM